mmetsp:Transcript_68669/g.121304  ORF Transcript_68669/g.121304 Transcript_68669/m.121304 type:complete len:306 (-) Transcript_68669:266-1183(-)
MLSAATFVLSFLSVARARSPAEFLGRYLVGEDGQQCVANDRPCEDGVDCCGVCAYIGASTWRCLACTFAGDECIPMGNRCCDGGNRQKDIPLPQPRHTCSPSTEKSEKYHITKYTCQASHSPSKTTLLSLASTVLPAGHMESELENTSAENDSFENMSWKTTTATSTSSLGDSSRESTSLMENFPNLLLVSESATANVYHQGHATGAQVDDVRNFAVKCFQQNPIDTSSAGGGGAALARFEMSLGRAIGCVLGMCKAKWGWKPFLSGDGSDNGGPYDGYGHGLTVVGVKTSKGNWLFELDVNKGR